MDLYQELCGILGEENVFTKEPMSRHTTFRAGGPADFFVTPEKEGQVRKTLSLLKEAQVPRYIMGNGSNLLVGDRGYRGVILQICKKMNRIRIQDTVIQAQAGALLSKVAAEAQAKGLTGFEFASGIPGSLGGAAMMNAGAYGGEMKQVLIQAQILNASGEIEDVLAEEMELGYRSSVFSRNGGVILSASIQLEPGDPSAIQSRMEELKFLRTSKQPLEYPSAGSTFKRPEGYFAGKLIQDAGLRGFQVGGAQVSEKHCGFVINKDQASAMDIRSLMEQVSEKVYTRFGVRLEPEVKLIGEF